MRHSCKDLLHIIWDHPEVLQCFCFLQCHFEIHIVGCTPETSWETQGPLRSWGHFFIYLCGCTCSCRMCLVLSRHMGLPLETGDSLLQTGMYIHTYFHLPPDGGGGGGETIRYLLLSKFGLSGFPPGNAVERFPQTMGVASPNVGNQLPKDRTCPQYFSNTLLDAPLMASRCQDGLPETHVSWMFRR
jgi:hypothetical protein